MIYLFFKSQYSALVNRAWFNNLMLFLGMCFVGGVVMTLSLKFDHNMFLRVLEFIVSIIVFIMAISFIIYYNDDDMKHCFPEREALKKWMSDLSDDNHVMSLSPKLSDAVRKDVEDVGCGEYIRSLAPADDNIWVINESRSSRRMNKFTVFVAGDASLAVAVSPEFMRDVEFDTGVKLISQAICEMFNLQTGENAGHTKAYFD